MPAPVPAADSRKLMYQRANGISLTQKYRRLLSLTLLLLSLFMLVYGSTCYVLRDSCYYTHSVCIGAASLISACLHFVCSVGKNVYRLYLNACTLVLSALSLTFAAFHLLFIILTMTTGAWGRAQRHADGSFPLSQFLLLCNLSALVLVHVVCVYESTKAAVGVCLCRRGKLLRSDGQPTTTSTSATTMTTNSVQRLGSSCGSLVALTDHNSSQLDDFGFLSPITERTEPPPTIR